MTRRAPMAASAAYRGLHRGAIPRDGGTVRVRPPAWLAAYGPLVAFEAERREPDGVHLFRHDFEPHARPTLASDETGQLHIVRGRYTVTDHGVEDTAPRDPARNTEKGMRHTYEVPLVNPSPAGGLPPRARAIAADVGVVGGTAAAYVAGTDWLLDQTTLGGAAKALVAAAGGLGAGYALMAHRTAPRAGLGLAVGGLVAGVVGLVQYARAQAYLRSLGAPAATNAAAAAIAPRPALAGALPGGAPAGYSLTTLDGCATGGAAR